MPFFDFSGTFSGTFFPPIYPTGTVAMGPPTTRMPNSLALLGAGLLGPATAGVVAPTVYLPLADLVTGAVAVRDMIPLVTPTTMPLVALFFFLTMPVTPYYYF